MTSSSKEMHRVVKRREQLDQQEADFARAIGESQQTVNNWKRRGKVPADKQPIVAAVLGRLPDWIRTGQAVGFPPDADPEHDYVINVPARGWVFIAHLAPAKSAAGPALDNLKKALQRAMLVVADDLSYDVAIVKPVTDPIEVEKRLSSILGDVLRSSHFTLRAPKKAERFDYTVVDHSGPLAWLEVKAFKHRKALPEKRTRTRPPPVQPRTEAAPKQPRASADHPTVTPIQHAHAPLLHVSGAVKIARDGTPRWESEIADAKCLFGPDWFTERNTRPEHVRLRTATDNNMASYICQGDDYALNIADRDARAGGVFAILVGGRETLRRFLPRVDGTVEVRSDSPLPGELPEALPAEKIATLPILGRVIWRAG